jgi:protein-L-isoaspartate(D-aspartate) O-methyltransferase
MNIEPARENMIYHQVRPWDVLEERILTTLANTPRERFVPAQFRQLAFADTAIPLPCDQSMLKPVLEGRLLQALATEADHRSLVIGTGSGFMTACVAALCNQVTSIDIHAELAEAAAALMADEKIRNVDIQHCDFNDFSSATDFDRILVTGSMPVFDPRLPEWLKDGGQMILIVGDEPNMSVERVVRSGQHYSRSILFETVIPPLDNVIPAPVFQF